MLIVLALVALLVGAPVFGQCVGTFQPANFGGHAGTSTGYADAIPAAPETLIDLSRPATVDAAVVEIDFRALTNSAAPFNIRFSAVQPTGTNYAIRNVSNTLTFTPPTVVSSQVYTAILGPALQFQKGDLLGVTLYSASGVGLSASDGGQRSGYLIFHGDATPGASYGRDSAAYRIGGVVMSAEAAWAAPCDQLPPPEVFIPAVGDVVGAAHFTTDLVTYFQPQNLSGPFPLQLTLRDRMGGSPRVVNATINAGIAFPTHPQSLTTALGVTPPYFGSLDVAFNTIGGLHTASMTASANITAATATCNGGGTGSAIEGVSCDRIGREIAIPFHIPANHRLNVGIASAQLHSCGIFAPATSAEVWINGGPHVIVPMPGESTQIGDITGAGAAPYGSAGLTDGVVYIRVTDEATRIVGYASLLDNISQDSSVSLGAVIQ